jgi:hypothetical protein
MKIFILFLVIYYVLFNSCRSSNCYNCENSNDKNVKYVSFVLESIWEEDNYKLIIDDGKFTWESGIYSYTYFTDYKNFKYIVEDYCTLSDSIKLKLYVNLNDSVFYIPSKNKSTCFIGTDINKKLILKLYETDSTYTIGYD